MPHCGTKSQQLNVVDVGIAGNQLHVGIVEKSREKTLDAIEPFARAGQVLHLAYDFSLPVLRARLALAQLDEAAVEQQQVGGEVSVRLGSCTRPGGATRRWINAPDSSTASYRHNANVDSRRATSTTSVVTTSK
jgi:hypothetical protein